MDIHIHSTIEVANRKRNKWLVTHAISSRSWLETEIHPDTIFLSRIGVVDQPVLSITGLAAIRDGREVGHTTSIKAGMSNRSIGIDTCQENILMIRRIKGIIGFIRCCVIGANTRCSQCKRAPWSNERRDRIG